MINFDSLKEGIELDFSKPFPSDIVKAFHLLINGNLNRKISCMFHYVINDWNYFLDLNGNSKKLKVTKYAYSEQEKLRKLIREYKSNYQNLIELDFDDGCFDNIGNQIMLYETEDKVQFRILPFGIAYDEKVYLQIGEAAYYFIYNKITRDVKISYKEIYDLESAEEEFNDLTFEENKDDVDGIEIMSFEGDFDLNSKSIEFLSDVLKRFEPNIYCRQSIDVIDFLFEIKKKIRYPIFSNREALDGIDDLETTPPEKLKEMGYHPECYNIRDCFGIDILPDKSIRLDRIYTLVKWEQITKNPLVGSILQYYHEIHKIKLTIDDIDSFITLFSYTEDSPEDIIKYVLRGVVAEKLDIHQVLKNTISLYKGGFIHTWKGKYSQILITKNNMRNYTKLSKDVLDNIEKKPTLDNLYKQLFIA